MSLLVYILIGLIITTLIFAIGRFVFTVKSIHHRDNEIATILFPIKEELEASNKPSFKKIQTIAKDAAARGVLYNLLRKHNRESLFPEKYLKRESEAVSSMVYWLLHPNEWNKRPNDIEIVKKISIAADDESLDYYVLRFRGNPHDKEKNEWHLGVSGPFKKTDLPYSFPSGTFSTFETEGNRSHENLVNWVHSNIYLK